MKTRVIEMEGMFYPQYKKWIFPWCYFVDDEITVCFTDDNEAINYAEKSISSGKYRVVWQSNKIVEEDL